MVRGAVAIQDTEIRVAHLPLSITIDQLFNFLALADPLCCASFVHYIKPDSITLGYIKLSSTLHTHHLSLIPPLATVKMLLKRKRSDAELSYGFMFASTQKLNGDSFNFDAMSAMETARRGFFSPRQSTPSHLHSRTMKRFRDNRPAESEVYRKLTQDTLSHLTFTYPSPRHL